MATSTDDQTSLSTDVDSQSSVNLVELLLDALHPDRPTANQKQRTATTPSLPERAINQLARLLQYISAKYSDPRATLPERFKVCGFFVVAPIAAACSLLWCVVMAALKKYVVSSISAASSVLSFVYFLLVVYRLVRPERASMALILQMQVVLAIFHIIQGSFDQSAAILLWICVTPSLTYILVQSKRATFLSVLSACFLSIVAVVVAETTADLSPALRASERLDGATRIVFCVFNIANPTLVVISVSLFHLVSVRNEQERADNLLCKMLPRPVARMLQRGVPRHSIVERFDNVTCFFSDIVGFTSLAERHTPLEVIAMLNALYEHMDAIASELKVFKVAVIGDSYFAVAGAPSELPAHEAAARVARFALAVRRLVANEAAQFGIHMRIGLHSGPVVAGVIGDLAPQFTLIGDTVNVASRMEAHGAAGRIHCSSETKLLLSDSGQFHFVARPPIFVKGKGRMQTYWLDAITQRRQRRRRVGNAKSPVQTTNSIFMTALDDSFLREANESVANVQGLSISGRGRNWKSYVDSPRIKR
jgi:class 3 adenylate cyclase